MGVYLGFDTSNYTTSAALYDSDDGSVVSKKMLLPVKPGELGLRQSDAVFHHTVQLPQVVRELFCECNAQPCAVGASSTPRDAEGSYMPCFLVGTGAAQCLSAANNVPLQLFSHQCGHIAAALYSSDRLSLLNERFIAFHVSGGTTEVLLVEPDDKKIIRCSLLLNSLDLKAGQAVDRVGKLLSMPFPSGKYVDALSLESNKKYNFKIKLRDGCCSLSGLQNKCEAMNAAGEPPCDICRYCLDYIAQTLLAMVRTSRELAGALPLVFSGGVMSNTLIRELLGKEPDSVFAQPEFSCDNAAGIAVLTSYADKAYGRGNK